MMTREPLERLLADVSDEDLESLRDAILREEGRRRACFVLTIPAPFPPLVHDETGEGAVMRWAKLLTWLAKDTDFPPATGKRGVSIRLTYRTAPPDTAEATVLLQQALVMAGLLMGRTPEWIDATTTEAVPGDEDAIQIQMWEKPVPGGSWSPDALPGAG